MARSASTNRAGFALFESPLGPLGIAWRNGELVAVQLPAGSSAETRALLLKSVPGAVESEPPRSIQRAGQRIVALLSGERTDLSTLAIDLTQVPPFHRRVYELARTIPPGQTLTYGEVAKRLGVPGGARAVGQALRRNPFAVVVPCHRVLAAGGKVGGFTAPGGTGTKLRLLAVEKALAADPASSLGAADTSPLFEGQGTLAFDPVEAIAHLRLVDARLARLMDAVGTFRLSVHEASTVFSALSEAIVYQQLHGKAAAAIYARLRQLFSRSKGGPSPEALLRASEEKLMGVGLSRSKMLALRDLAARTKQGELPTFAQAAALTDDEIVERLTRVRGIGRWTVEMLLIFRLGRPDVLPVDDYGVRKGFALAYGKRELPTPRELMRFGERWRPYRTAASWYLWRALELPENARAARASTGRASTGRASTGRASTGRARNGK